VFEHG